MTSGRSVWLFTGLVYLCTGPGVVSSSEQQAIADPQTASPVPAREYRLWYRNYDSPPIRALMALALEKTPEYGPFDITRSPEMAQGRVVRELEEERSPLVDVANIATSPERETNLHAIPLPVDGGLLGLRVCVTLRDTLPEFEGIRNVSDLQRAGIRIGQGTHWPDTDILRINGITVITHSRYEILFRMLENRRFECFARGASEVLFDLELEGNSDMVIEPDLLLAYPMPSYFFVSQHDYETAQRLRLGMERAIHDGSFGKYLEHFYGRAIEELDLEARRILVLENPFLTEDSRLIGRHTFRELWRRIDFLSSSDFAASDPES